VCAIIGIAVFFVVNQDQESRLRALIDEGVEVTGMDRRFVFIDRRWEYFQGKYALSGGLVMAASPNEATFEISGQLYLDLCEDILAKIAVMRDAPTGRNQLFRLVLSFPVFNSGEPTGQTYGQPNNYIPIDEGACPSFEAIEKTSFNTYPGVLRRWGLKGFYEYTSNLPDPLDIAAVFAPRNGRVVPPLPFVEACQAALFDFEAIVPNAEKRPDKLAILLLGKPANDIEVPKGESGLGQHFVIEDGSCLAISEVFPLERKD
jgi:hypothetical protein